LAILLGVGPIFILMTLFEPTKRFFDAWLGQALNYVFVVMLTAAAVKLVITIVDSYLGGAAHIAAMTSPKVNQAIPAIVFSMIGVLVMMQLPSVASALGGGVAIGTLGAVSWAYGKTKGTFNALRPTNLKRSVNKIRSDFRIAANAARSVGSGAKAVGGAPMAVYRKITGSNKNRG
jgi:type IV secretion system protein VirB6